MSMTQPNGTGAVAPPPVATTPRRMRQLNRSALLTTVWGSHQEFTATDLMAATGLTRATVLDVCRDLTRSGWLLGVTPTAAASPGRQALRFTFNVARAHVVGADIGRRSVAVAVADLGGAVLGRGKRTFSESDERPRGAVLEEVLAEVLSEAGLTSPDITAACVGIAAPVTERGEIPPNSPFWKSVAVDREKLQELHPQWRLHVENDANLAALAEMGSGDVEEGSTFLTLLSGERLGAGLVLEGSLHRGAHGAAGEMDYLEQVVGVGGSHGIASLARMLTADALRAGLPTAPAGAGSAEGQGAGAVLGEEIDPVEVLHAADRGDAVAQDVVEQISKRLAIAISTLGYVLDPELVVIAGGIAEFSTSVLKGVRRDLADMVTTPPRVVLSTLGRDVVLLGALKSASDVVRGLALQDAL